MSTTLLVLEAASLRVKEAESLCPQVKRLVAEEVVPQVQFSTPRPTISELSGTQSATVIAPSELPTSLDLGELDLGGLGELGDVALDTRDPPWVATLTEIMSDIDSILSAVGLGGQSDTGQSDTGQNDTGQSTTGTSTENGSRPASTLASRGADVLSRMLVAKEKVETVASVMVLSTKALAGGHTAYRALRRLHTLLGNPFGAYTMRKLQLGTLLQFLIRRQATPDLLRGLALSLETNLSHLPAAVQLVDPSTGSYYHMDV
ncbi:hypothetical protein GNI_040540 [Gregarina niphandrodes]|uniref:Uncharacterized protein n=1 Tax=Gregarina niphandrodes TaxID=110365 RepID=A0A023BA96_GRENI|nr:hypothetical protein GNI_040540 [Gregarina niphandrodes]EZG78152.1 hypothetical protein GNI_040540 [Gregarina niphandrodes]|eukprot:XP_011129438.1 hypothetical protein GNI_040540 [Gregarina niphandrodes]